MELRDLFKLIRKKFWLFIATIVIVIISTYLFTASQYSTYTGSLTIYTVINPQQSSQNYYEFDSYYAFQASESLLDSISSWFKDPAYISTIYSDANENLPKISYKNYAKLFSIKKNIPSSLVVSISSPSEQYVRNILESAREFSINNLNQWQSKGLIKDASIVTSDLFVVNEKPNMVLNISLALIGGIILGSLLILAIEYFKKD